MITRIHASGLICFALLFSLWGVQESALAQSNLFITQVSTNWPTVEAQFKVQCANQPANPPSSQDIQVFENGILQQNVNVSCSSIPGNQPVSAALLFDASGSMTGPGQQGAILAGNAFVDSLDGNLDEAMVLWFNSTISIPQAMTNNKTLLHTAIRNLPASGATAVIDAIYTGIQELVANGSNNNRAVIVLSDGLDNASVRSVSEVIALANRNRLIVFAVGLGVASTSTDLQNIAQMTGGAFIPVVSASHLPGVYRDIVTALRAPSHGCMIDYNTMCKDGAVRTLQLVMNNYCGAPVSATATFTAPLDTLTFQTVHIGLGNVSGNGGDQIIVPVELRDPVSPAAVYGPSSFYIQFNPSYMEFDHVVLNSGMLLSGANFTKTLFPNRVDIHFTDPVLFSGQGVLAGVAFNLKGVRAQQTVPVILQGYDFHSSCFKALCANGQATIDPALVPIIEILGSNPFCAGEMVTLQCIAGFTDHQWSNNATGDTTTVWSAGAYTVTAKNYLGNVVTSAPVTLTQITGQKPAILSASPAWICDNDTANMEAQTGFADYVWSNGWQGRLGSFDAPGWYTVTATDTASGCRMTSDPVQLVTIPKPQPVIIGNSSPCGGGTYTYTIAAPNDSSTYSWYALFGTIVSSPSGKTVDVLWEPAHQTFGEIAVRETGWNHCTGSANLPISILNSRPAVTVIGSLTLCLGSTVTLRVPDGYAAYAWNVGGSTSSITVNTPGTYFCVVTGGNCSGVSDTVHVTGIGGSGPAITGEATVCALSVETYSIGPVPGAGYYWSVSNGDILTGAYSNQMTVRWRNLPHGIVRVNVHSGACQANDTLQAAISTVRIPSITPLGSTDIAQGDTLVIEAQDTFTDYRWSNNDSIRWTYVTTGGEYFFSAMDSNGCRTWSDTVTVTVYPASPLKPAITPQGSTEICENETLLLEAEDGYTRYRWSNGEEGRWAHMSTPGNVYFTALDANQYLAKSSKVAVSVLPAPYPVISFKNDVLSCDIPGMAKYEWYKDGVLISGSTGASIPAQGDGTYTVVVTSMNSCEGSSAAFVLHNTGIFEPTLAQSFSITPNPSNGVFEVALEFNAPTAFSMRIVNVAGQTVYTESVQGRWKSFRRSVSLTNTTPGMYFFILESAGMYDFRKMVVR